MLRRLTATTLVLTLAAGAFVDINPVYLSPPGSPILPSTLAISNTGDIAFATGDSYYVKKHIGNVKYNEFKASLTAGDVVSPPNFSLGGLLSFVTTSPHLPHRHLH